jgi:hypothetical protein
MFKLKQNVLLNKFVVTQLAALPFLYLEAS